MLLSIELPHEQGYRRLLGHRLKYFIDAFMMHTAISNTSVADVVHLWRVSYYCRHLAEAVGLPRDMVFLSALGGFLHDIGKISIPDEIL